MFQQDSARTGTEPGAAAAGAPASGKSTQAGAAAPGERRRYDGSQLQAMIRQCGLPPEQIEQMALAAGLTGEELAALRAGAALELTPAQEAALREQVAAAYAEGPAGRDEVVDVDICGSSGNPTPSPSPAPSPAPAPALTAVPPVTGTHTEATEVGAGTTIATGTVPGGTVTLRHDVHYRKRDGSDRPHGFALRYQGTDPQNAHWLQFIWREIIQQDAANTVTAVTGSIASTGTRGGTYALTTGGTMTSPGTPGETNYNTDTTSSTDPFYEVGGTDNRTADATTIYDHPSAAETHVRRAFANGATHVKSRAHFVSFLVQTDRVTYRAETNVEWDFPSASAVPTPAYTTGTNGAATALSPDALRNRFRAQFPAFRFIP